jgi:hypothetical protein
MRICTLKPAGIGLVLAVALSSCRGGSLTGSVLPAPGAAAPLSPPPVELAGAWRLAAATGGTCTMNFADGAADSDPGAPAAAPAPSRPGQGTIAPEGGCPGDFFTSRQWTFEAGSLIIRDFRNRPLAQLSYSGASFQGQDARLGALTLSKRM